MASLKRKSAGSYCDAITGHLKSSGIDTSGFVALFSAHRAVDKFNTEIVGNQAEIFGNSESLKEAIRVKLATLSAVSDETARTADSPLFISRSTLNDPSLINRAVSKEDTYRVEAHQLNHKCRSEYLALLCYL